MKSDQTDQIPESEPQTVGTQLLPVNKLTGDALTLDSKSVTHGDLRTQISP
jgi:hypothetical protein